MKTTLVILLAATLMVSAIIPYALAAYPSSSETAAGTQPSAKTNTAQTPATTVMKQLPNNSVDGVMIKANAITTEKIADKTIVKADISPSFMKFVQLSDGKSGWTPGPGGPAGGIAIKPYSFTISDRAVKDNSIIMISVDGSSSTTCSVFNIDSGNRFQIMCTEPPSDGAKLNYGIINP